MKGKTIAFLFWTAIVVAGYFYVANAATKDHVRTGTKIEFNTGRDLMIEAETVTFEAASSEFFIFRKENGETIVSVPTERPLGWSSDKYYVAASQEISGGKWLFQDGTATVKITNSEAVTVREVQQNPKHVWFILALSAVLIWLMVIVIAVW